MSFHLVLPPLKTNLPKNGQARVKFVKILPGQQTMVVMIAEDNKLTVYDFEQCKEIGCLQLTFEYQKIDYKCIEVRECYQMMWLMTREHAFWVGYDLIRQSIAKRADQIEVNRLSLRGHKKEEIKYESLMNKQIKVVAHNGLQYMKLIGRSKDAIFYYCGLFSPLSCDITVSIEYQEAISPLLNPSLQSFDRDILVYRSFTNKSKPIQCFVHEFIQSSDKQFKQLTSELQINHFCKTITVSHTFKLDHYFIALFCNENYQQAMSFMIIYNFREKYTHNYLTFNNTTISRVIMANNEKTKGKIVFKAAEISSNTTKYFMLTPDSYIQKEDNIIQGNLLSADSDYLVLQDSKSISFSPKIHKKSLYSSFLSYLLPDQKETHSLVLSLL